MALVPNVGIVVGDEAALVIDTGLGFRNGTYVLDHARRLAGHRPLYLATRAPAVHHRVRRGSL